LWAHGSGCAVDDLTADCLIRRMATTRDPGTATLPDAAELRATAQRLGAACAADQVILFGSRARGQAANDSDVDLALILPDGADTRARLQEAHRLLWPRRFPIDLVAIPASVWRRKTTLLARQITAHGVVLYDDCRVGTAS
jgi:predicted nucleotidyltransferase